MNNQRFDEHIKGQFTGYEPPVPAHIWDSIVLERDHRRPAAIWWLHGGKTIALLLIITAIGTGLTWYANELATKENTPLSKTTNEAENKLQVTSTIPRINNPQVNNVLENNSNAAVDPGKVSTKRNVTINTGNTFLTGVNPGTIEDENAITTGITGTDQLYPLSVNYFFAEKLKFTASQAGNLSTVKHGSLPTPCPEMEKNTSANKKYVDFYAGPDYAMASYSDTGNSNYKQLRQASTKTAFGFSAGVRYTKVFNNSMSVRAGINYSQVNEKFTYKQGNIVQVVYIINNNGDTTGSYSVTGTRYKNSTNIYRMADIPLAVGYEMGNERLHVNINAGVIVNVYSWQKGNVVDTSNNPVDISSGTNSPYSFKTNAGIGFTAGAAVYYKLNDRLHLMAEPYYRYNLSQANKPGITLKQKFNTAGIRLGVRLDIP